MDREITGEPPEACCPRRGSQAGELLLPAGLEPLPRGSGARENGARGRGAVRTLGNTRCGSPNGAEDGSMFPGGKGVPMPRGLSFGWLRSFRAAKGARASGADRPRLTPWPGPGAGACHFTSLGLSGFTWNVGINTASLPGPCENLEPGRQGAYRAGHGMGLQLHRQGPVMPAKGRHRPAEWERLPLGAILVQPGNRPAGLTNCLWGGQGRS